MSKSRFRIEPTEDGFFDVWSGNNPVSDHPFVNRKMAEGWIRRVEDFEDRPQAQAGEAGTAETPKSDSVHEHAVGNADAPKGESRG